MASNLYSSDLVSKAVSSLFLKQFYTNLFTKTILSRTTWALIRIKTHSEISQENFLTFLLLAFCFLFFPSFYFYNPQILFFLLKPTNTKIKRGFKKAIIGFMQSPKCKIPLKLNKIS